MITQYLKSNNNIFQFVGDCSLEQVLSCGVYKIGQDISKGLFLHKQNIQKEVLISIPNSPMYSIMDKIDNFLTDKIKNLFKKYGMIYKRGILLYGPPGTGKTSVVNQIIDIAVERKNMIVLLNPTPAFIRETVHNVRSIEKTNRPFMVVWEEFEDVVSSHEGDLLNLLDGVEQVENIIYLATTNYIHEIPERIVNRPSRFADIIEIGFPNEYVRKEFIKSKLKDEQIDFDLWAKQTEGFTIDHLKDLIINVFVLGIDFNEAITRTRNSSLPIQKDKDFEFPTIRKARKRKLLLEAVPCPANNVATEEQPMDATWDLGDIR